MTAPLVTISTSELLPKRADVVVVGGGIVGTSTAYWLARAGQSVTLLEKGHIGAEQSSRNWGWCRQQNRDARELPLATRSLALWEDAMRDCGTGLGFRRCGLLYLSNTQSEIDSWAAWKPIADAHGVETHMLTPHEATDRGAATGRHWRGGVWSPTDGVADPSAAAPILACGVMKHGGTVLQNCAARGLETQAGRVSAVITEKGHIATSQVIVAGGAWAGLFLHQLGISFPQASVRSSILSVAPGAQGLPHALHTKDVSLTRRSDGGYTLAISGLARLDPTQGMIRHAKYFLPMFAKRWQSLSPGGPQAWRAGFDGARLWSLDKKTPMEEIRILSPKADNSVIKKTLARGRALLPELAKVEVQATWAGYIDSTPDGVPVIDADVGLPGLAIAAGLSGHGFGIGPGVGHLMADLVLGRKPITESVQYRLDRFSQSQWGRVAEF
ncbi:MAG: FAD-binding oxidoreductase [Pseudomonadota bacterium]